MLADTSYNSQAVDEVAAAHINADCVVHYGLASFAPVSRLPAFFVLPREPLDCGAAAAAAAQRLHPPAPADGTAATAGAAADGGGGCLVVFTHQGYAHCLPRLETSLREAFAGAGGATALHLVVAKVQTRTLDPPAATGGGGSCTAAAEGPAVPASSGYGCASTAAGAASSAVSTAHALAAGLQLGASSSGCDSGGAAPAAPLAAGCCDGVCTAGTAGTEPALGSGATSASGQSAPGGEPASPSSAAAGAPSSSAAAPDSDSNAAATAAGERYCEAGYAWSLPSGTTPDACRLLWLGPLDSPTLAQLQLTRSAGRWAALDPGSGAFQEGLSPELGRLLKRRYFLVEKTREASIVGLLVRRHVAVLGLALVVYNLIRSSWSFT